MDNVLTTGISGLIVVDGFEALILDVLIGLEVDPQVSVSRGDFRWILGTAERMMEDVVVAMSPIPHLQIVVLAAGAGLYFEPVPEVELYDVSRFG